MALLPAQLSRPVSGFEGLRLQSDDFSGADTRDLEANPADRAPALSPRAASETFLTDRVEVSGSDGREAVVLRAGLRIRFDGTYTLARGVQLAQDAAAAQSVTRRARISGSAPPAVGAPTPGIRPGSSADFDALLDEMAGSDPKLYQALVLLAKMLAHEDPEQAQAILGSFRELRGMLQEMESAGQGGQAFIQVFTANIEASWQAVHGQAFASGEITVRAQGQAISIEMHAGGAVAQGDPLVLDLAGDGIRLRGAEEGVRFDLAGTGQAVQTGFVGGDDALLYVDQNGNGIADSGRELFGDQEGYVHGFAELASWDENRDGVIDAADAAYEQLRLFQDRNGDGVNQQDETLTLQAAGIEALPLAFAEVRQDDGRGNMLTQIGHFVRQGGTRGLIADALLKYYL